VRLIEIGQRLARAGQVLEDAALLRVPDLLLDPVLEGRGEWLARHSVNSARRSTSCHTARHWAPSKAGRSLYV
jgi:hypothetical protein